MIDTEQSNHPRHEIIILSGEREPHRDEDWLHHAFDAMSVGSVDDHTYILSYEGKWKVVVHVWLVNVFVHKK